MPTLAPGIAITGMGLVTAVGQGAAATAAAVRAGIARFSLSESTLVPASREGTELEGAALARVPALGTRWRGAARAGALLAPALAESLSSAGLTERQLESATWDLESWVGPPDSSREVQSAVLLSDLVPTLPPGIGSKSAFAGRHARLSQCALFQKVAEAGQALARDPATIIVVAVVDSLSTPPAATRLAETGRLKSALRPDGIIPGEAAGAFVLEHPKSALQRGAKPLAVIEAWGAASEPNPWIEAGASSAQGLTEVLREAVMARNGGGPGVGVVVSDLNGERSRALEWSLAGGRVFGLQSLPPRLWHPADCVGDCGAASGAVLLAVACAALGRSYARTGTIVLVTSDDGGERRALTLASVPRSEPVPGTASAAYRASRSDS